MSFIQLFTNTSNRASLPIHLWEGRTNPNQVVSCLLPQHIAEKCLSIFNSQTPFSGLGRIVTSQSSTDPVLTKRLCFNVDDVRQRLMDIKKIANQTLFKRLAENINVTAPQFVSTSFTDIPLIDEDTEEYGFVLPFEDNKDMVRQEVENIAPFIKVRDNYLSINYGRILVLGHTFMPPFSGLFPSVDLMLNFHQDKCVPLARKAFVENACTIIYGAKEFFDGQNVSKDASTVASYHALLHPDVQREILHHTAKPFELGLTQEQFAQKIQSLLKLNYGFDELKQLFSTDAQKMLVGYEALADKKALEDELEIDEDNSVEIDDEINSQRPVMATLQ